MSQTAAGASGLVRVTVTSGSRRVDLVLPAAVPVAELVPELARSVGLLDAHTVYAGYRLVTQEGRHLDGDVGLLLQGVEDGGVLTVTAGVSEESPRVYDDVVEAMADVVESELRPWQPEAGRRTALGAASVLLSLGAAALLLRGESVLGGVAAALGAALLVTAGVVLSRTQDEPEAGVVVSLLGALYAAVAGLVLAPGDLGGWQWPLSASFFTDSLLFAGIGVLVVGLVAMIGLREGRALVIPAVVVGAVLITTCVAARVADVEASAAFAVVLTLVVVAGSVFPWLALGATSTKVEQLYSHADITNDPEDVDRQQIGADARVAHEILIAVAATVGALLVLFAPFLVARGVFGTVLVVMCCVVVMMRTRQYRSGSEVLGGLMAGILGLASAALSMLLLHETWRTGAAVALAVIGAVLLVMTLVPSSPSVRRGRLGDVAETIALLSLLPLLVLAIGLFSSIRG